MIVTLSRPLPTPVRHFLSDEVTWRAKTEQRHCENGCQDKPIQSLIDHL